MGSKVATKRGKGSRANANRERITLVGCMQLVCPRVSIDAVPRYPFRALLGLVSPTDKKLRTQTGKGRKQQKRLQKKRQKKRGRQSNKQKEPCS